MKGLVVAGLALASGIVPGDLVDGSAAGLNHVYVVLDQRTFDAIRTSPEIATILGRSDGGLPDYAPPAADADRLFFRGRHTYLELFAPKNRFDEPVGKVGIGIGADRPDRFERLAARWRRSCGAGFSRSAISWTRSTPNVPWYDSIQCRDTATRRDLAVWAMVYRPDFQRWQQGHRQGPAETSRKAVLAPRKAAGQGRFDIVGLDITVPADLHDTLAIQFENAGFLRRDSSTVTRLHGEDWDLVMRRATGAASLSSLVFRTAQPPARTVTLGAARLIDRRQHGTALQFDR